MQKVSILDPEFGTNQTGGYQVNMRRLSSEPRLGSNQWFARTLSQRPGALGAGLLGRRWSTAGTLVSILALTIAAPAHAQTTGTAPTGTAPTATAPAPNTPPPGETTPPDSAPDQSPQDRLPASSEATTRPEAPDAPVEPARPAPQPPAQTSPAPPAAEPAPPGAPTPSEEPSTNADAATLAPNPTRDAQELQLQGAAGPDDEVVPPQAFVTSPNAQTSAVEAAPIPDAIFAEDWWTHARPIVELHGSLRTRADLFYNYSLGRVDLPSLAMWARPTDARYLPQGAEELGPRLCTGAETDSGSDSTDASNLYWCDNETQASANLRLRFNPEIHISDNLRIHAQVDLFDNLVLGSTPSGYRFASGTDGLEVVTRSGNEPLGFFDSTQVPPDSSRNSISDSIVVRRAWGEYTTPLGELRFGRMPNHWGLGMLYNSGDGHDDDYQSTIDRIMFTTGIKPLDLFISAAWEFPNEGAIGTVDLPGAQPYDLAELDDVNQYSFVLMRKKSEQLEKQSLSRGDVVFNAGVYFTYRQQTLANDQALSGSQGGATPDADPDELPDQFARRDATAYVPDLWLQLKYKKFRFELEAAAILGRIGSDEVGADNQADFEEDNSLGLQQFGLVADFGQRLIEDRLHLGFSFGWASGDADAYNPDRAGAIVPGPNEVQINDDTLSTFRFHPGYRVDLILNRSILQRVQGTYFLRPSVEYDFLRDPEGQRAGGSVQAIWTRASEFVQTPGHDADLGLELNASLYFQARDGVLNDAPEQMGGFYATLQYGVLFPLAGMGYQPSEVLELAQNGIKAEVTTAMVLRSYLGIMF